MPTTNPVPSYDPTDLLFNAQKLDEVVNSTSATYADRLGVTRRTLAGLEAEFPNAQANAAAAAASAVDAAEAAQIAQDEAVVAISNAAAAQTARAGAEAARDAALIQAGVYVDEATGRAAVLDGQAFKVQGSGDVAAREYRRVNSTTSTLIATYPSSAAYDALAVRASDLESARDFVPGADSRLRVIKRLRLFGANTAKFYSVRYFFRNDVGTRFNFTVTQADDFAGTNPVDVCSFSTTDVNYSGLVEFTLSQMSSSGVTGTLVVDFTSAPASFSVIRGANFATFANLAIRHDAVGSSVAGNSHITAQVASSPSVAALQTRASDIESARDFVPGIPAAFRCIKKLRLLNADNAKHYSVRYFLRNDVGTRFSFVISRADDAVGTNPVDVCQVLTVNINYSGLQHFTLSQANASGITGTLVIDFDAAPATVSVQRGANFQTFATLGIRTDSISTSPATDTDLSTKINNTLSPLLPSASGQRKPFIDGQDATGSIFSNTMLRGFVKNIWLYGAKNGSNYRLSFIRLSESLTCYIDITDETDGRVVARWTAPDVIPFASQPRFVKGAVSGLSLANWCGEYFVMELDWTFAAELNGPLSNMTRGGIHADCVFSDEQTADFLQRDVWHEVVRVGPGQSFTTLRAAIESLYPTPSLKICWRSHYHRQILIQLDPGAYNSTDLVIPEYVGIMGAGRDKTFLDPENSTKFALLQAHLDTKIMDMTIRSLTGDGGSWAGEYCIHSDDVGIRSWGGVNQGRRIRQAFKRLRLVGGINNNTNLFGGGFSSGQHVVTDDIVTERLNPSVNGADLSAHNTAENPSYTGISAQTLPVLWEARNCRSSNVVGAGLQVISLGSGSSGSMVKLDGCNYDKISRVITNATEHEWTISGVTDAAIVQSGGSSGLPDTGYHRRMLNNTGAALVAGRFVKRTGAKTVAYAGPGDRIYGWIAYDIANGSEGNVITNLRIADANITGASSSSGEFGLSANGFLDYGASSKIGIVIGSIVTLYK